MISSIALSFEEMEPMRGPYQTLFNGENSISCMEISAKEKSSFWISIFLQNVAPCTKIVNFEYSIAQIHENAFKSLLQ